MIKKDIERNGTKPVKSYTGKTIVSIQKGKKLGKLEDVLIAPGSMEIAALVTSHGWLPWRDLMAIPTEKVQVWGEDVILVETPDVVKREKEIPETKTWLSVSGDLVGRDVINTDGDKVGEISDLLMNTHGELSGFQLSQIGYGLDTVLAEGPGPEANWIPKEAVHSIGQDVLVIEVERMKSES